MALESNFRRSEPYSVWERKHAIPRSFPFSDGIKKYWCFKHYCDFRLSSLGRALLHEKFAHSRHPLTGDYGDWLLRTEDEEERDHAVLYVEVKESDEDVMYRKMMQMSMNFFERTK